MIEFIDKTSERSGTPLNRKNMMAIQGFITNIITFNKDGSIVETNDEGHVRTTTFTDTAVVETFVGEKTITKTTTMEEDGSIKEVVSL